MDQLCRKKPTLFVSITASIRKSEAGLALIEFALFLPIILAVTLGGLEFARAMKVSKTVSTLSSEAANTALRECAPVWEELDKCLKDERRKLKNISTAGITALEVVISVYGTDPTTGEIRRLGMAPPEDEQRPETKTRFCFNATCDHEIRRNLIIENELIVVGEVFAGYKPVVSVIPKTYWFNPEVMYEFSIF